MKTTFLFLALLFAFSTTQAQERLLKVQGNSSVSVKPTTTTITLTIESKSTTYVGAVEDMISRVNLLSKEMQKIKFSESDMTTSNFNVRNDRIYVQNMWKDSGFVATQTLNVNFPQDKKRLLEVLNTATKSGAKPSVSLSFDLDGSRKTKVKNELIRLAVEDAKSKAEIIASASGYQITGIQEIQYGQVNPGPQPLYEMAESMAFSKRADVSISNFEASNLTYSDGVSVIYLIEKIQ